MAEYGLADVAADIYGGYQQGELDRGQLDSMRNKLMNEGFQVSMKRLAMGDVAGAQETWNKTGKHRIENLARQSNNITAGQKQLRNRLRCP